MSRFELGKGSCGTSDLTVDEDDASIDASNASLLPYFWFISVLFQPWYEIWSDIVIEKCSRSSHKTSGLVPLVNSSFCSRFGPNYQGRELQAKRDGTTHLYSCRAYGGSIKRSIRSIK